MPCFESWYCPRSNRSSGVRNSFDGSRLLRSRRVNGLLFPLHCMPFTSLIVIAKLPRRNLGNHIPIMDRLAPPGRNTRVPSPEISAKHRRSKFWLSQYWSTGEAKLLSIEPMAKPLQKRCSQPSFRILTFANIALIDFMAGQFFHRSFSRFTAALVRHLVVR